VTRGIALHFSMIFGTRWGWGISPTPRPPLSPRKILYPLHRRLGGPQSRSELVEILVPTGIRSRTVQPVAKSLYRLSYTDHPLRIFNTYCFSTLIMVTRTLLNITLHKLRYSTKSTIEIVGGVSKMAVNL